MFSGAWRRSSWRTRHFSSSGVDEPSLGDRESREMGVESTSSAMKTRDANTTRIVSDGARAAPFFSIGS